jgi:uncharacterized protein involved in tellurium resistance
VAGREKADIGAGIADGWDRIDGHVTLSVPEQVLIDKVAMEQIRATSNRRA